MAKYWFGSLEQITEQHDKDGNLEPTAYKAVKGWKVPAKDYPMIERGKEDDATRLHWVKNLLPKWLGNWIPENTQTLTQMEKDRNALAEQFWADAETWWESQQVNKDLKGEVTSHNLDYQPIRETGDYQLKITGPIDIPEHPEANRPKEPVHTDKEGGKTLDKKGKTL